MHFQVSKSKQYFIPEQKRLILFVTLQGDIELKAITRLATHPIIEEKVSKWRKEHEDWKALAAFLMSKNTGRRYKKNKNKKITTISKKEKKLPTTGQSGEADQGPPTVAQKPKQRDGPSAKDLGKQASLEFKKNHIDKLLAIRLARKTGSLANLGPPDEDVQQLTQGEVPEAEVEEDSKEEKDTGSSNDKSETVRKNDDAADVSDISDDGEVPEAKVEEDSKEEKDTGSSNDKSETVRKNDDAADVSDISDDGEVPEAEVEEDSKEEKDTGSSNEKSETVRKNDDAADVSDISDDDVSKDQASSESSEAESASQEESVSQEESSNDAEDSSVEAEETRTKITPHPSEPTTRGKTGDLKPKKHSQQDSVHKKTYTVDATLCKEMEIRAINLSDISEVGDIPVTKQNDPEVGFLFKSNQVKDDSNKTLVTVNKKKKRDSFFASVDGASDDDDTNDDVAHPGPAGTEEEEEDESYAYHIYARQKIQSTFVKALSTHKEQSHTDSFDKRQGHRGFSRQREEHFSPMGRGRGSGRGDHQRHDRYRFHYNMWSDLVASSMFVFNYQFSFSDPKEVYVVDSELSICGSS